MSLGLLDLANPVLSRFDALLAAALPAIPRIVLISAVLTYLGMWLYRRFSPQTRLRALKRLSKRADKGLHNPDIEFDELLKRAKRSIRLQLMIVGNIFLPSLLGMLPLLFALSDLSQRYSFAAPESGQTISWCVQPEAQAATVSVNGSALTTACTDRPWQPAPELVWQGTKLTHDLDALKSNILHARQWWNVLLANPAGYLPDAAGDLEITVQLPEPDLLGFGPGWLNHWLFWFLVPSVVLGFYWRWRWKLV